LAEVGSSVGEEKVERPLVAGSVWTAKEGRRNRRENLGKGGSGFNREQGTPVWLLVLGAKNPNGRVTARNEGDAVSGVSLVLSFGAGRRKIRGTGGFAVALVLFVFFWQREGATL
jgi:hypothetical protein